MVRSRWLGDHRHAGSRHLLELKGLIYDEVRLHELKTEAMPGFRTEAQQQLAYPMILTGSEAQAPAADDAVRMAG